MTRFARAGAIAALLAMTAGCGSTAASSQPPARIPAHAGIFSALPSACSLVKPATLQTLRLKAKPNEQTNAQRGGVREKTCAWGSPADDRGSSRSLVVIADLFTSATGQAPATAAEEQFQQNTSDQAQADASPGHAVSGLGDEAFTDEVTRSPYSQSQVTVRDQNVLVTVNYGAMAANSGSNADSAADQGALTAARAVLAVLSGT